MLAIIAGTSLIESALFAAWKNTSVQTPYGGVTVKTDSKHWFLQRHGDPPMPPHRINHRAHIWALKMLKVTEIVAFNSVGSLKLKIEPAALVLPHDFISPWDVPTMFDHEMRFTVPEMDTALRSHLEGVCRELGFDVVDGGVYIQTKGPRLETKAEIRYLRRLGDIVGMTMASEATLCTEVGLHYTSLCSVDNYCNGISKVPLTVKEIETNVLKNSERLESIINGIISKDFKNR
ncbi:MAG: MTAP family purine nucleoside phosphorylase [Syntrophobacterales bacterium]|jgi:5'-methylthioadenosine phosphorylase|nr:MTAP family purine nucleoside phosphorylase [Syntrophobacterales bacterium]